MEDILNRKNLYLDFLGLIEKNKNCAIATVTFTQGSTPQKPGSSAIFSDSGLLAGTVGGGYVEHDVFKEATNAARIKKSGYFRFNLDDEIEEEGSVICGGRMRVLIDANPEKHLKTFQSIDESNHKREPGVLVTTIIPDKDEGLEINRYWGTAKNQDNIIKMLPETAHKSFLEMIARPIFGDFKEIVLHTSPELEDNHFILETLVPLPQLVIAGAGHIGKALSSLGKLLDFEVTVWDDRAEFANKTNLPRADTVLAGDLEKSFEQIEINRDTFIVIVTRGHQYDTEVLKKVIHSKAGYIGMIGSKKKVAQLRDYFIQNGWTSPETWDKIHSPIGLSIHSETVQEIAVSIAAQLIKVRHELNRYYE
jgi:xanthine dehydrogenase accessory factor